MNTQFADYLVNITVYCLSASDSIDSDNFKELFKLNLRLNNNDFSQLSILKQKIQQNSNMSSLQHQFFQLRFNNPYNIIITKTTQLTEILKMQQSNILEIDLLKYTKRQCRQIRNRVGEEQEAELEAYLDAPRKMSERIQDQESFDEIKQLQKQIYKDFNLRNLYLSLCPSELMILWPEALLFPPENFPIIDLENNDYIGVQVPVKMYRKCLKIASELNGAL